MFGDEGVISKKCTIEVIMTSKAYLADDQEAMS